MAIDTAVEIVRGILDQYARAQAGGAATVHLDSTEYEALNVLMTVGMGVQSLRLVLANHRPKEWPDNRPPSDGR